MKFLFGFNTVIFLATLVAMVEPVIGLIFMFFLGLLNVIQSLTMLAFLQRMNESNKRMFLIYGLVVPLWLMFFIIYMSNSNFPFSTEDLPLPIGGSMLLGGFFVIINGTLAFNNRKE